MTQSTVEIQTNQATVEPQINNNIENNDSQQTMLMEQPDSNAEVPADLMEIDYSAYFEQDQGREQFSTKDKNMPFLLLLQSNSPQCKKSDPKHIEGAEEGDILSTFNDKRYKPDEGVRVIHCAYKRSFIEYTINESGKIESFVCEHPLDSNIRSKCQKREVNGKMRWFLSNNHEIIDTAYQFVLVVDDDEMFGFYPAIIKMTRTKHSANKEWNTEIDKKRFAKIGNRNVKMPVFASIWRMTSFADNKDENSWVNFKFEFDEWVKDKAILDAGLAFQKEILSGKSKPIDHTVDNDDSSNFEEREPGSDDDSEEGSTEDSTGENSEESKGVEGSKPKKKTPF